MNTGPFHFVQADVPGDFRTMNTGPFQGVQADVPGDFRTFKLDASGCGCECVARFVVLLGLYIGSIVEFNTPAGTRVRTWQRKLKKNF